MAARVSARGHPPVVLAASPDRLGEEQKVGNLPMRQDVVNFLGAYRSEIVTRMPAEGTPDHYYFGGQLSLIDNLIKIIGEGHFERGFGSVQEGVVDVPAGVDGESGGSGEQRDRPGADGAGPGQSA